MLSARKSSPQASADFDRCCDRTAGKPRQTHEVEQVDNRHPHERAAELLAHLRARLGVKVPDEQAGAAEPNADAKP